MQRADTGSKGCSCLARLYKWTQRIRWCTWRRISMLTLGSSRLNPPRSHDANCNVWTTKPHACVVLLSLRFVRRSSWCESSSWLRSCQHKQLPPLWSCFFMVLFVSPSRREEDDIAAVKNLYQNRACLSMSWVLSMSCPSQHTSSRRECRLYPCHGCYLS